MIVSRRKGYQERRMKITILTILTILTIYYALGAALFASIHEISAYDHSEEIDDFQIDVDQEVDVVSCYRLVDTTISLVHHSFLHHMLTSFGFRYDPNCTRCHWRSLYRPKAPEY
jgi:hypothetical protein